jgi:hypothetical protein
MEGRTPDVRYPRHERRRGAIENQYHAAAVHGRHGGRGRRPRAGWAFATGAGFAQDDSGDNGDAPPQSNPSEGEFEDDIDVLNYALTLEHLEAEFSKEAFDDLGAGDFQSPTRSNRSRARSATAWSATSRRSATTR